jgi:hypothetical protein
MHEMGWDRVVAPKSFRAALATTLCKADDARHQQLAFAGWLTCHRPYREEKDMLAVQWKNVSAPISWPLLANTADQEPMRITASEIASSDILPEQGVAFVEAATSFMRKWNLARLVTWDLPVPLGPLEQIPLGLARHILGPDTVGTFFPAYFDIPSGRDMRGEIREQQEAAARDVGIGVEFPLTDLSARAGSASAWENVFRLWFIEQAARQRYADRRGLSSRLIEAFAEILDCSVDWVKKLRQDYIPFATSR